MQYISIQRFYIGIPFGKVKEQPVGAAYLLRCGFTLHQFLAAYSQFLDLPAELFDHLLLNVIAECPCDVVAVGSLDHLLEAGGLLVDVLDLYSGIFATQGGVGLLDGVLRNSADRTLVKGQQLIEVTTNDFHQVIVADTRPMQAAGLRSGTQVVAYQIPVFRPFAVVDGAAGTHCRTAAGTVGDTSKDAVAERGVCPVRLGVFAHEVGSQIEFFLRHQSLVGVLREHPFLLR